MFIHRIETVQEPYPSRGGRQLQPQPYPQQHPSFSFSSFPNPASNGFSRNSRTTMQSAARTGAANLRVSPQDRSTMDVRG